jgi:hypothetical protein
MILRSLECQFLRIALCDAAEPWQLGSQDAATPMVQGIIDLHHDIFFFLILTLVFVSRMLVHALWHFNEQAKGHLLLVARAPDHSDYLPPAPEGEEGPPTPNVIIPPPPPK